MPLTTACRDHSFSESIGCRGLLYDLLTVGTIGWTIGPTITFHFAQMTAIDSINIYYDDAIGFGGISSPASFVINGVT